MVTMRCDYIKASWYVVYFLYVIIKRKSGHKPRVTESANYSMDFSLIRPNNFLHEMSIMKKP